MPKANLTISATDRTRAVFAQVDKRLGGMTRMLGSMQAKLAAVAGVGGFGALIVSSNRAIETVSRLSTRLGTTTAGLSELQFAARQSNVTVETLSMGLQRMTRRVAEAAHGTGEAKDAIKELGLDARALANLRPEDQFARIAEQISQVGNAGDRVRLAMKVFDSEGVALIQLMENGAAGIAAMREEARALNQSVSDLDAAKVVAANDAMVRVQAVITGIGRTLSVELAPFIEAIANRFVQAAKDSGGWRDVTLGAVESVTVGVAKMMDVWRGLQAVFKLLEVALQGFVSLTLTGLDELNKAGAAALNWLPGVDIQPSPALSEWAQASRDRLNEVNAELFVLANAPMPSDSVRSFFATVKAEAQAAAEAAAAAKRAIYGNTGGASLGGEEGDDEDDTRAQETQRARLAKQLETLQQYFMSERELLAFETENRELLIEELFQEGMIRQQERNELLQQLEADHQSRLTEIDKQGWSERQQFEAQSLAQKASTITSELTSITAGVAQHNKTMFAINKAAAIAGAVVSAHEGASRTLAKYPYPLGPALAALHYAAGMARVSAIASTKFQGGGGGTSPSTAGSVPVFNDQPVGDLQGGGGGGGSRRAPITIQIEKGVHDHTAILDLVEQLNELGEDGLEIRATVLA